jgi:hypothetical protein
MEFSTGNYCDGTPSIFHKDLSQLHSTHRSDCDAVLGVDHTVIF